MKLKPALLLALLFGPVTLSPAQGSAFTYQGRLVNSNGPVTGLYDISFGVFDSLSGGFQVGTTTVASSVVVSNGLFAATVDPGLGVFAGADRWLAIAVRTNGAPTYSFLTPRQPLKPAPYATFAGTAGIATGLVVNAANTAALQNNSVTLAKLAPGVLQPSNFPPNSVTSTELADTISLGSTNSNGMLYLYRSLANTPGISLDGSAAQISTFGTDGQEQIRLWGASYGEILLHNNLSNNATSVLLTANGTAGGLLRLNNTNATVRAELSGANVGGALRLYSDAGAEGAHLVSTGASWLPNGLTVDNNNANTGSITGGLVLGASSGEGIGSKRSPGDGQYGIDFYTSFINRMIIDNNGNVGIGTTNPTDARLDLEGSLRLNDNNIYFRANADRGHGLGHRATLQPVGAIDGPFLYGYNGGALGVSSPESPILFWNYVGNVWVSNNLSAASYTTRGGADIAEPFQMSNADIPKGSLVIIDDEHPGRLKISDRSYDTRVAGIVSGANGINPGIVLQQEGFNDDGAKVALSGRVYALADATKHSIKPGDLLTSSDTPGHVMKASSGRKSQGAIVGKAMTSLKEGKGMVLVLVTLQ